MSEHEKLLQIVEDTLSKKTNELSTAPPPTATFDRPATSMPLFIVLLLAIQQKKWH